MFGFRRKKTIQKADSFEITEMNQLYRALYAFLSSGSTLGYDSHMKDYVKDGYEENPDLFSIIIKLAGMFAGVPLRLYTPGKDGDKPASQKDIDRLMSHTNYFQTFDEFRRMWAVSYYLTGNAITYAPKYPNGYNKGKITRDGLLIMPTQNVQIISGGWREPISKYVLDIDQQYKIDTSDVWHERFAPTMQFEDGKNFMGQSPVKVARRIINAQNAGYEITESLYEYGHPPGIISKEDSGGSTPKEQESRFRATYKRKYQGGDSKRNITIPIFTLGKLAFTKIGFDNLQELQVINMSEHGRRIFCNLLQVPSELFNDTQGSTYNNMNEAAKAIYTNRIIPDINAFVSGFNQLLEPYGDYFVKPDYSGIQALQEDMAKKVEWLSKAWNDSAITINDYRRALGLPPKEGEIYDTNFINVSKMPVEMAGMNEPALEDSNKYYQKYNMEDKL